MLLAALLLPFSGAGAQLLRMHAVEEVSGRPAAGAIADVMDSTGAVAAQVVLSAEGRREVVLVRPGTYRVQIRRIGYPPYLHEPVVIASAPVELRLALPSRRVTLAPVEVTAPRCANDMFTAPEFRALWDEIHKALTSASLGRQADSTGFEMRAFRRQLGRNGRVQSLQVSHPWVTGATRPFQAAAAAELAQHGYIRSDVADNTLMFYGPDEDVLRSDAFVSTHCFSIVRGEGATEGLFGMQFAPAAAPDRRAANDIAGTLWLDPKSAELRHIDFRYVTSMLPPTALGDAGAGGRVVFQRLPSGRWIVGAWHLRMPRFPTGGGVVRLRRVDGFDEFGGVVTPTEAQAAGGSAVLRSYYGVLETGEIDGTVYDSLRMQPLANARVWLVPITPSWLAELGLDAGGPLNVMPTAVAADAMGRWKFTGVAGGTYRVGFEHPSFDTLAIAQRTPELRLAPGARAATRLYVPTMAALSRDCRFDRGSARKGGLVVGYVYPRTGEPLPPTTVRDTWIERSRTRDGTVVEAPRSATAPVARDGSYQVCGVPLNLIVEARAIATQDSSAAASVLMLAPGLGRARLQLGTGADTASTSIGGAAMDSLARVAHALPLAPAAGAHWRHFGARGYLLDTESLAKHATLRSALEALPAVRVATARRVGGPMEPMIRTAAGECAARIFVDGRETDSASLRQLTPTALAAVELHPTPATAPIFASGTPVTGAGAGCGVLLFWTVAGGAPR